jgi:MFS family permease
MSRFRALSSPDYRLIFFGQLISLTGTQMQHVAVAWQLYLLTHSPLSLGMIGLFRVAPVLLFALGGGVVADALDRRLLMIVTQVSLALLSLTLAVATLTGHASALTIYMVVFLSGVAIAFDAPARQSLLPLLVDREDLPNALSLMAMVWQIATVTGPAIAGVVIARYGVLPVYFADLGSFAAVIFALLFMKHRAPPSKNDVSLKTALEGLRFIRKTPLIWSMMLLDFFATFFAGSMLLMPIFADELLAVGAEGLGLLYAAQPLGGMIATGLMSVLPTTERQGWTLLASGVLYGASIAGFGLSSSLALSIALLALSGASDLVSTVIRQTIRQMVTPDEMRGRMTSVNMIFFMGGPQLGEVEAGVVAGWIGVRASVASGGLLAMAAVIVMGTLVPALRRYRHATPLT